MRTPLPIPQLTESEASFIRELMGPEVENGCMPWLGKPFCSGELAPTCHGTVTLRNRTWAAHRVVYALMKGPIPDGLWIDHLCGIASCVNPLHLEAVEPGENGRREGPRNRERLILKARLERLNLSLP